MKERNKKTKIDRKISLLGQIQNLVAEFAFFDETEEDVKMSRDLGLYLDLMTSLYLKELKK